MISILIIVLGIVYFVSKLWTTTRQYPPGPTPFPLIGNVPQLAIGMMKHRDIVKTLHDFSKNYGTVFTLWLGPLATVHITDYETAHKSMVKEGNNFRSRWTPYLMSRSRQGLGIIATGGEVWQEHRRFALHTLRNFGLGKNIMEDRIMQEFHYHCDKLDRTMTAGAVEVKVNSFLDMLVGSIINRLLVGYGYTEENKIEFLSLKHNIDKSLSQVTVFDQLLGNWATHIPPLNKRIVTILTPITNVIKMLQQQIDDRKTAVSFGKHSLDEEQPGDFLDAYFVAMEKMEKSGEKSTMSEVALAYDLLDLWMAGMETTVITIQWALHYLLLTPRVMDKCLAEMTALTCDSRPLSLTDRPYTPYLNATINEIQRHASIANLNLWRRAEADCEVGGHFVPAGTPLAAQISVIMSEQKHFENAQEFRPERYLGANGKELEQMTIPFSIGKRACLGESLARAELYLIIGNLLLHYSISPVPSSVPSQLPVSGGGIMHRPRPLTVKLSNRV